MALTQQYDLILDADGVQPIGLMFDRTPGHGAQVDVASDPGNEPAPDAIYADFSGGMGSSEIYLPSTYAWGENVDTTVPGVVLPGGRVTDLPLPAGSGPILDGFPLRSSFEFQGHLYFTGGRYVVKIANGTSGSPTIEKDLGANVATETDASAIFNGTVYLGTVVASSDATYRMWSFDGATWTEHATVTRRKLAVVYWDTNGVGAFRLIGMPSRYEFQSCAADPTNAANWGGATTVGNSSYSTLSLVATARHVYFAKQDGIWDVDARGYSGNLTPYWEQNYDLVNGVAAKVHQGHIYGTCGLGLDRVPAEGNRQDVPQMCQPGEGLPNGSPVYGYVNAITADRGWIVAALVNTDTNKSYICYGKDRADVGVDGYGPLIWHGALAVIDGTVTHMRVTSPPTGPRRLWICWNNSTDIHLSWMSLPKSGNAYQDWRHDGDHIFTSEWSLYLPDGWSAPTARRIPWRYDIHADNLDGVTKIEVYSSHDQGAYALQGSALTSPRESFIAANVTNSAYRVDLRLDGFGTDESPTVFRAIRVRADVNREQVPIITYRVRCADGQALHLGARVDNSAVAADATWERQSEQATPITIIDRYRGEYTGQILPGISIVEQERRDDGWELVIELRVRVLYAPWNWDSGIAFDGWRRYS